MLQSRRYRRGGSELPATIRRSCQEAQDTFTTARPRGAGSATVCVTVLTSRMT